MRDLHGYLSDRLGFSLFEEDEKLEAAVHMVEIRNIIVHNRAVVNRRFLSRVPESQARLGERLEIVGKEVSNAIRSLGESCSDIDVRAASKFGLSRPMPRDQLPI
jgi:hypothetical protein